jgi:hypothetical protein
VVFVVYIKCYIVVDELASVQCALVQNKFGKS